MVLILENGLKAKLFLQMVVWLELILELEL